MNRKGFTLIEFLVVVGIIGIVVALVVPLLSRMKVGPPSEPSEIYALFSGEHELRRMVERQGTESHLSGGGFFIFGTGAITIDGRTKPATYVTFAWKHPHEKGTFIISTLPVEKIMPQVDASAATPRIRFQLYPKCGPVKNVSFCSDWPLEERGVQAVIDGGYVVSATLVVREEDWPKKIQLPLS